MTITRKAVAGTLESSDIFVEIEPADALSLEVQSIVYNQFGEQIEQAVREVLTDFGITGAQVSVNDRGALDCTIRARVETALLRAKGEA